MAFRVSLVKRFPLKLLRKQSRLRFVAIQTGKKRSLLTLRVLYARRKGWIDLYAAQQVFCHVQRLVVLLVRRNVGLRAGLFLACVALEVAAQCGLALGAGIGLRF